MKQRILFLEQYAKLSGGQRVLLSLLDGLRDEFECIVTIPEEGELSRELTQRGIPYYLVPVGYYHLGTKTATDVLRYALKGPWLIVRLTGLLRRLRIDMVYANGARTFPWATVACGLTHTPLVWHVHSIFSGGWPRRLCTLFGRSRWVTRIIAVSAAAQAPLQALSAKTRVLHNAIDTRVFYPGENKNGGLRAELSLPDSVVFGMVGLLVEWKGVDDFIRAAGALCRRYPGRVQFVIVGDVLYDEAGRRYKQRLLDLVRENGITGDVFFTGFRRDVPEIFRCIDVFVLASRQPDPCPTALLQAMASGAAVIAPDEGGPRELIENGRDGLLYPARDVSELINRCGILIEQPQVRREIAAAAVRKIRDNFAAAGYLEAVRQIVLQALCPRCTELYQSDRYARYNPGWHQQDSGWKVQEICRVLPDAVVAALPPDPKVVDVGCGAGQILKLLSDYFRRQRKTVRAVGYDLSETALRTARKNFPEAEFYAAAFTPEPYRDPAGRINITLLIDILEHVADPVGLLRQAARVSDYIVCHIPLEDNWWVNIRGLRTKFRRTVGHIHFYHQSGAYALFAQAGLRVLNERLTCSDVSAQYRLPSLLRRIIAQPLRRILFGRFPQLTARYLGNCSLLAVLESTKNPEPDDGTR